MGLLGKLLGLTEEVRASCEKASSPVPPKGKGTRPDGSNWWQVRVRLPNGLVIEEDPFGNERYRWTRRDGTVMTAREPPKMVD